MKKKKGKQKINNSSSVVTNNWKKKSFSNFITDVIVSIKTFYIEAMMISNLQSEIKDICACFMSACNGPTVAIGIKRFLLFFFLDGGRDGIMINH
uniref:Uncharacterized protein n=1 Tax=Octopus bimaculoides TaxID=37653 RepID=A0A0L8HYM8_OCTBM